MYKINIQNFQGPLDLLLQLIEQQKMEITEISIAHVTDQYIEHIEQLTELDAEELSDFLVLAARLLLLKSKALLPLLGTDEEEVDDLEKQLKMYKEFLEAAQKIDGMIKEGKFLYSREKPPVEIKVSFSPSDNLTRENLRQSFMLVLKRLDPLVKMPKQMIERTISLQQKMLSLKEYLNKAERVGFRDLLKNAKSKTEVIVNFLAILELAKQRHLRLSQGKLFDDIILEKNK